MKRASEKLTVALLIVSCVGLVGFAIAAFRTIRSFETSRNEVMRNREALVQIWTFATYMRQTTNAARGFIISGDEGFIANVPEDITRIRDSLNQLGSRWESSEGHDGDLEQLRTFAERRIEVLTRSIDIRRTDGKEPAERFVTEGEGRRLDDAITSLVNAMHEQEASTVSRRFAQVDEDAQDTFTFLGIAILCNFALVASVFLVVRRELRTRENASDRLAAEATKARELSDRAEQATVEARRTEELFRRLFENSPDAMILVDAQRHILRANARAHQVFGWNDVSMEGCLLDDLLPERFRMRHTAHLAAFFQAPRARPMGQGLELFGYRRDGVEFPVDIMLSPLSLEGGVQVIAVIRDITARKQAEQYIQRLNQDLKRRAEELEYANKELEAFSYSVSHDLRAPLRHIAGFADMLKLHSADSGSMDAKSTRYLDTIIESARRMGALIDDLLMFSRTGRTEMVRQPVNLTLVADEVRRSLDRDSQGRSIEWKIGVLPEVMGDVAMLRQVMFNLVSNAVKYSRHRENAVIEIATLPAAPGEVVCYVKDNGAGFDMKYVNKLFGVFQRLHGSTEFEGTGVGLAIVRRIIQRHGGRAWAEAAPDKGATFYFSIPTHPENQT